MAATAGLAIPITVGAHGSDLVLMSWLGAAVQVFDPQNRAVKISCSNPDVPLNGIGYNGRVVVSELSSHRVALLDQRTCARTTLAGLPVPTGLATDGDDLWVADWSHGIVFQIGLASLSATFPVRAVGTRSARRHRRPRMASSGR